MFFLVIWLLPVQGPHRRSRGPHIRFATDFMPDEIGMRAWDPAAHIAHIKNNPYNYVSFVAVKMEGLCINGLIPK